MNTKKHQVTVKVSWKAGFWNSRFAPETAFFAAGNTNHKHFSQTSKNAFWKIPHLPQKKTKTGEPLFKHTQQIPGNLPSFPSSPSEKIPKERKKICNSKSSLTLRGGGEKGRLPTNPVKSRVSVFVSRGIDGDFRGERNFSWKIRTLTWKKWGNRGKRGNVKNLRKQFHPKISSGRSFCAGKKQQKCLKNGSRIFEVEVTPHRHKHVGKKPTKNWMCWMNSNTSIDKT